MKYKCIWTLKIVLTSKLPEMERGLQWPALCEKIERLQLIRIWKKVIWEFPPTTTIKVITDGSFIKRVVEQELEV